MPPQDSTGACSGEGARRIYRRQDLASTEAHAVGACLVSPGRCNRNGKVRYRSEHSAKSVRGNRQNKGSRMRAYFCAHCHGWHLTTEEKRTPRANYQRSAR